MSSPSPPTIKSAPLPPSRKSFPAPPSMNSDWSSPSIKSSPSVPMIWWTLESSGVIWTLGSSGVGSSAAAPINPPPGTPWEMLTSSVGASATATTSTLMVCSTVVMVSPPSASVAVAVTVSVKSSPEFGDGVTVRLASCSATVITVPSGFTISVIVHVPSPLSAPAESSASRGTPEMVMESVSEPSVSVRFASMASEIAVSSSPVVSSITCNCGSSAMAATSTLMVPVVEAVSPPAVVDVAVTVRSKSSSESGSGSRKISPPSSKSPGGIL